MRKTLSCWKLGLALVTLGGIAAGAADAQTNLVTEPGFEGTMLQPFSPGPLSFGDWNAEDADIITGTDGATGIVPFEGSDMLRINETTLVASQVNQIIDANGLVDDCCCRTLATYQVWVNADQVTPMRLFLIAGDGLTGVGTPTNRQLHSVYYVTDDDPDTWELVQAARALPPGTTVLELQIAVNNDLVSVNGLFADLASVVLETNLVTDGCFEPGTQLHPFFRQSGVDPPWMVGEWNQESADITGPSAGISPKNGIGMLRVTATGGSTSQVNQIISVGDPVSADGDTIGTWSVCVNAPAATPITLHMTAGDGQSIVGSLTNPTTTTVTLMTDDKPDTWELLKGSRFLPASTLFLELQLSAPNGSIPVGGFFVDCANVVRSINRLTDPSFESGTVLHAFYRQPGNDPPWMPGEWNQEDADLTGTVSGVMPLSGTQMLRVNKTSLVTSQVNQIIAVPPDVYAAGDTMAIFGIYVNAPVAAATPVTLTMRASNSQTSVGTLFMPAPTVTDSEVTDADLGTWQLLEGTLLVPQGTKFLEMQISAPNDDIDPTDGFFVDLGRVTFVRCERSTVFNVPVLGGLGTLALAALVGVGGVLGVRRRREAPFRGGA